MQTKSIPEYFEVSSIGSSDLGFISIVEYPKNIPFEVKRVYWTYYTPQNVIRGFHAHHDLEQLVFSVAGSIKFKTEDRFGDKKEFELSDPNVGLYIPPYVWREIVFSHSAVLLCLASQEYDVDDYIRNYDEFKKLINEK